SDGSYSKAGIHSIEFYVDDSLRYAMHLDRVPAEETKEIDIHYDFPTILHGWGRFQKLYIDSGNTLPFYDNRPVGTGAINTDGLTEGEHSYRIVCKDVQGNATDLSGEMIANHRPEFTIDHVDADGITLTGSNLASIQKVMVFGRKNAAIGWNQHTLPASRFER